MFAHLEDRAQCTFRHHESAIIKKSRLYIVILLTLSLREAAVVVFVEGITFNLSRIGVIHLKRYDFISQGIFWRTICKLLLFKVAFLGGLRLHLTLVTSSISELLKAPLLSLVEVPVCFLEYRADLLVVTSSPLEQGNQGSSWVLFYLFAEYILFVYKRYFFLLLLRCIIGLCHLFFSFFSGLFVVPL